jgi:hypothetical protein
MMEIMPEIAVKIHQHNEVGLKYRKTVVYHSIISARLLIWPRIQNVIL